MRDNSVSLVLLRIEVGSNRSHSTDQGRLCDTWCGRNARQRRRRLRKHRTLAEMKAEGPLMSRDEMIRRTDMLIGGFREGATAYELDRLAGQIVKLVLTDPTTEDVLSVAEELLARAQTARELAASSISAPLRRRRTLR